MYTQKKNKTKKNSKHINTHKKKKKKERKTVTAAAQQLPKIGVMGAGCVRAKNGIAGCLHATTKKTQKEQQ